MLRVQWEKSGGQTGLTSSVMHVHHSPKKEEEFPRSRRWGVELPDHGNRTSRGTETSGTHRKL